MLGNIFPPFTTMQEMNLDWILTKVKNILRFVPDDGTVGQILRRTRSGAEWSDEQGGSGAVNSVNGQTGDVVLTAPDVGALPDTYVAPVTSVNGMTGDVIVSGGGAVDSVNGQTGTVVLDADDVGALPDTTVIPDSTSDLVNDSGFVNAAGAAAAAPVQSVNGQTGAVSLTIPDNTSDLNNDSGFVDAAGAAAAAPVQSVNGQTGAVVINENDSGTGYCKMPDGTLICWGEENSGAIPANGAITVYATFPEAFIATPVVTCVARYASTVTARYFQAAVHTIGTTGVQLTAVNTYSNTVTSGTHFINWIAIGRWKN